MDEDFGDFTTAADPATKSNAAEKAHALAAGADEFGDFGDFATADDFGDFAVADAEPSATALPTTNTAMAATTHMQVH